MRSPEDPRLAQGVVSDRMPEGISDALRAVLEEISAQVPARADLRAKSSSRPKEDRTDICVVRSAREVLGELWGVGRPLAVSEFRILLRLPASYGDQFILDLERGYCPVPGPVAVAVELMLKGAKPKNYNDIFTPSVTRGEPTAAVRSWRPDLPSL